MAHPQTSGSDAKKKTLRACEGDTERVRQARQDYHAEIRSIASERLTFIDESGINLSMTRTHGRAPRGERVIDHVPKDPGVNVTLIGALSLGGLHALMTIPGATTGEVFLAYVEQVLGADVEAG